MHVSVFTDDHLQTQHSGPSFFANAQNTVINDGNFVGLSHLACGYDLAIIVHRLSARTIIMSISLPILPKGRRSLYLKNQIAAHSLLDAKMYSTNFGKFLLIVLHRRHDALVSSGDWEGSERPRSVSRSQRKCLTGE